MMAAYLDQGLLKANPFENVDTAGVGELVRIAVERGRAAQPGPQDRRLRRARRRPGLDRLLREVGPRLRQLLAVPGADRPARSGPRVLAIDAEKAEQAPSAEAPSTGSPAAAQPTCSAPRYRPGDGDSRRGRGAGPLGNRHPAPSSGSTRRSSGSGRRYVGLCPFHAEKSASFSVNAEEGLYYCFGCQASGDAITFLRNIEGCDFVEAVERLAARAGIAIRHDAGGKDQLRPGRSPGAARRHGAGGRLLPRGAARATRTRSRARQYLRSRGYEGETVRQFSLGWAPEAGRALVRARPGTGRPAREGRACPQGQPGLRDAFRGRVIFPIFDPTGKAIGLGGRILPGAGEDAGPEVPQLPRDAGLCEAPHPLRPQLGQAGGRAGRRGHHLRGLHRRHRVLHRRPAAGRRHLRDLAHRGALPAPRAGSRNGSCSPSTPTRPASRPRRASTSGSNATSCEVAVAALPPGSDPADLAMREPEALREAVEKARTFLAFRVETGAGQLASSRPAKGGPTRPRPLWRWSPSTPTSWFAISTSSRYRTGPGSSSSGSGRVSTGSSWPSKRRSGAAAPAASGAGPSAGERAAVAAGCRAAVGAGPRLRPGGLGAWRRPERAGHGRSAASRAGGTREAGRPGRTRAGNPRARSHGGADHECLFADPVQRAAYRALADATSLHEAVEGADEEIADLLRRLAVSEPDADPDQTVVALARTAAQVALGEVEADARQAEAEGDARAARERRCGHHLVEVRIGGHAGARNGR